MTWKSLSPPRGLQLNPSCQARCPVKTSNEMENYPAPSAAQLFTMLLHREHFCSYLYYMQINRKTITQRKHSGSRLMGYFSFRVIMNIPFRRSYYSRIDSLYIFRRFKSSFTILESVKKNSLENALYYVQLLY